MSVLASQVDGYLERASWIRKMFEEGARLKAEHGADKVFDFSLGNPDVSPPPEVGRALETIAATADRPLSLGYMPNSGYPSLCQALAARISEEQGVSLAGQDVVVTCGAAGGLNALLRAVLEPGEEVVAPAPFFVEYGFYAENHGGVFKPVPCAAPDFDLDLGAMEAALTDTTRVVLINSPNNPTGRIYSEAQIRKLAELLKDRRPGGRPIFLCSDEPYRFLTFDGAEVPPILSSYEHAVVANSFSKSLSLAGERVGYLAVNPDMEGKEELLAGLNLTNRILGFVNAPAVGQRIVEQALDARVDVSVYQARRRAMAEVLDNAGVSYPEPQGAFYFFPQAPGGDDVAFCQALQEELILAVPGRGFGWPGSIRLTFCVNEQVIRGSAEGFARAAARLQ